MRIVITHDFMETYGGAERVTAEMAAAFPEAPVITLLGRQSVAERMGVGDRWASVLPSRRRLLEEYRLLTPMLPALARSWRIPEADVLISSTYAFAHHFRPRIGAAHLSYCHSPLRFAWSMQDEYASTWASHAAARLAFGTLASAVRVADRAAASGVTRFLTSSPYVAEIMRRSYGCEPRVIGIPIDTRRFAPRPDDEVGDHFLLLGRITEPYKRVEAAVEAFRQMPGERLVVAGTGRDEERLRRGAPPNVEFVGELVGDEAVRRALAGCRALIFPSVDDFGLVAVEAMACGRPVLAFDGGGARHTVLPGVTGELMPAQTPEAIVAAVSAFDPARYDPEAIRRHAMRWDRGRFHRLLRLEVERAWYDEGRPGVARLRADRRASGALAVVPDGAA